MPKTLIGWLNFCVFQWFFFRLAGVYNIKDKPSLKTMQMLKFVFPIVPLTGWWSGYLPQGWWHRSPTIWRRKDDL